MKSFNLAIAVASACVGGIFATPASTLPQPPSSVEQVVSHLTGVMDTSAQAAANADKANVRMTTCKVLTEDSNPDTVYLYQEQALNESLDSPYRQRILAIAPSDRQDIVVSRSYKLENTAALSGYCDRPLAKRVIENEKLGEPLCSVFLEPLVNVYVGTTQPGGCPTNFRGAVTITNKIILHDRGMDTWDRGLDAEGKQVWGADESGYQYRWQERSN